VGNTNTPAGSALVRLPCPQFPKKHDVARLKRSNTAGVGRGLASLATRCDHWLIHSQSGTVSMSKNHGPDDGFRFERRKKQCRKIQRIFISLLHGGDIKRAFSVGTIGADGVLTLVFVGESCRDKGPSIANSPEIERSFDALEGRPISLTE